MSECPHCRVEVPGADDEPCSFECERAAAGQPIPCRFCDFEAVTVGRYRHHVAHDCPKASESFRAQREIVLDRDGRRCQLCGEEGDDVEHILPPERFDTETDAHWPGNLITLCGDCRLPRHRDPLDLFRMAYD